MLNKVFYSTLLKTCALFAFSGCLANVNAQAIDEIYCYHAESEFSVDLGDCLFLMDLHNNTGGGFSWNGSQIPEEQRWRGEFGVSPESWLGLEFHTVNNVKRL